MPPRKSAQTTAPAAMGAIPEATYKPKGRVRASLTAIHEPRRTRSKAMTPLDPPATEPEATSSPYNGGSNSRMTPVEAKTITQRETGVVASAAPTSNIPSPPVERLTPMRDLSSSTNASDLNQQNMAAAAPKMSMPLVRVKLEPVQPPSKSSTSKTTRRGKQISKAPQKCAVGSEDEEFLLPSEMEDEDNPPTDVESERIDISDSELEVIATKPAPAKAKAPAPKGGRSTKAASKPAAAPLIFKTMVKGVTKTIVLDTSSSLSTLRDEAAEMFSQHHSQLDLYYTTIWGNKADWIELHNADDWEDLIAFVIANLNKKKNSFYHVELFDGIASKETKKSGKGTKSMEGNEMDIGPKSRLATLTRITQNHYCTSDKTHCYIVKTREYEPRIPMHSHHPISRTQLILWANAVMAVKNPDDLNAPTEECPPDSLLNEILGIKKADSNLDDAPPKVVAPKARGMNGPSPAPPTQEAAPTLSASLQEAAPGIPNFQTGLPPTVQPMVHPGMWPGLPYPYMYPPPPLPSPYKRALLGHLDVERPMSPTRQKYTGGHKDGARIAEWLEQLDESLDSDDDSYLPLLDGLTGIGVRRVRDVVLLEDKDIQESTGCSKIVAKRLIAKAAEMVGKK